MKRQRFRCAASSSNIKPWPSLPQDIEWELYIRSCEVFIHCTAGEHALVSNHTSKDSVRTCRHYGFRLPRQPARFRRRWTDMATHLARRNVGDHGTPDVVHAHSAVFAGEVAADLGRELGVPYVLKEHSSRYLSGTLTALQKFCTVDCLAAAGAVIAVSHRLKAALHNLVDRGDIKVVPNVVDTKLFSPPQGSRDGRTFRFVCIAALGLKKNVPLLIRAFHRAFPETEFVALEIVGEWEGARETAGFGPRDE